MKIDPEARYIFLGSRTGLVVAFNIHNFEPISEVMTLSAYAINNIELFYEPQSDDLCLLASLSSG